MDGVLDGRCAQRWTVCSTMGGVLADVLNDTVFFGVCLRVFLMFVYVGLLRIPTPECPTNTVREPYSRRVT